MQTFKFKIGKKEIEITAPDIDWAYHSAYEYAILFNWRGKITFIK